MFKSGFVACSAACSGLLAMPLMVGKGELKSSILTRYAIIPLRLCSYADRSDIEAPTIFTVLESWATNSNVGQPTERQRFLRTHMVETDNILEILLRLVRGERSTFTQNAPLAPPSVSGPLLTALEPGSAHSAQQTHVSLAVLALYQMGVEYAVKASAAGEEEGKREVGERVGEIVRCLPSHLTYKSLDGMFKEWRIEKKGR